MKYATNKHQPPEKCAKADWLSTMILNVKAEIAAYIACGWSRADAIARVKKDSCAGPKVWEAILKPD